MCSSGRSLCAGSGRSPSSRSGSSSGSQYALCALGFGLVALGIVMIVWTVVPQEALNSTLPNPTDDDDEDETTGKTSAVAFVLVGAGVAMLLLAACLGVRNKQRLRRRETAGPVASTYMDHVAGEQAEGGEAAPAYDVPSYDEAVTSGQYPIRQSNLRQSTSQLPSYEDLIAAVENEGDGPAAENGQDAPTSPDSPAPEPQPTPTPPAAATANPTQPTRSSSRASRILRPLWVRRIKSEKLHVKELRLNIRTPGQDNVVTIEPLTPPPLYDDKEPEQ